MTYTLLEDGHGTIIHFASNPSVSMEEKTVTPPGIAGGGANDVTTMRNTTWRTLAPKKLKTLKECGCTVSYDPKVFDEIVAMINDNQLITIEFPDGTELEFYGWLDDFDPKECKEGEQPTADIKIICSNRNDSGTETAPNYNAAASTTF